MYSTCDLLSITGSVCGINNTDVNPPFIADCIPVFRSSLYSKPGSRKLECISIQPVEICRFLSENSISFPASNDSLQDLIDLAIFSILPFLINISIILLWCLELGSIIRADLISKFMI